MAQAVLGRDIGQTSTDLNFPSGRHLEALLKASNKDSEAQNLLVTCCSSHSVEWPQWVYGTLAERLQWP